MKENIFVNLVNSLKAFSSKAREKEMESEIDVEFSKVLLEENKKAELKEKEKSSTSEIIYSKKESKDTVGKDKEFDKTAQIEFELSPLLHYLYNIVYKNIDALSIREKQAFGLDKGPETEVGIKELEKFLKQRGVSLSELDSNQLRQLVQRGSRASVIAFLDDFLKQRIGEKKEAVLSFGGVEKIKESGTDVSSFAKVKLPDSLRREEVIRQIIEHVKFQNLAKIKEVTIMLNPEYLGEVKVKISVEGKRTFVEFQTSSGEVGGLIKEGENDLKRALELQGLKPDELKVSTLKR